MGMHDQEGLNSEVQRESKSPCEEDDRLDDGAVKVDSDEEYAEWILFMYKYSWLAGMIFATHN